MDADSLQGRVRTREPIRVDLSPTRAYHYAATVTLCGEHDIATADAIRVALLPLFGNVLVDLSECDFIDSTVIRALLEKAEDLRREGHRLELLVPPEKKTVRRIVSVIGLETVVTVHERLLGGYPDPEPLTSGC